MKNPKAQKLLNKIHRDLNQDGLDIERMVRDLKDLRPFAIEEENPLLTKVIRLTYEHLANYNTFDIAIPEDEPLDDEEEISSESTTTPEESLDYLLSLMDDTTIKNNISDLREYRDALIQYSEEN
ncbi:MAG: hypothetical protein WCD31_10905 [Gillisia sp.]